MADDEIGYAAALSELDAILRALEAPDVDVDSLAEQVARATALITICRTRISAAAQQIEHLGLSGAAQTPEPGTAGRSGSS